MATTVDIQQDSSKKWLEINFINPTDDNCNYSEECLFKIQISRIRKDVNGDFIYLLCAPPNAPNFLFTYDAQKATSDILLVTKIGANTNITTLDILHDDLRDIIADSV
jgi:hypothetical protein